MNKEETIRRYGEEEYKRRLAHRRAYYKAHNEAENAHSKEWREDYPEKVKARKKKYREAHKEQERARDKKYHEEHPEQVIAHNNEQNRKGGKRYDKKLEELRTGLQGERNVIRAKHGKQWRKYKMIIAPESQIHHEWIPKTSEYRGVALVEKEPHQYGIVDVIEILAGKITLLTEEEIRKNQITNGGV